MIGVEPSSASIHHGLVVVPSSASIERDVGTSNGEKKTRAIDGSESSSRDDGGSEEGALEAGEAGPKGGE